mmetsp:Transcript_55229/g.96748  ORF Transcript_55229/g.96748 Transcript_55229/m.96748 type:complete len:222 (+) Transcript_55229:2711-3376(+)
MSSPTRSTRRTPIITNIPTRLISRACADRPCRILRTKSENSACFRPSARTKRVFYRTTSPCTRNPAQLCRVCRKRTACRCFRIRTNRSAWRTPPPSTLPIRPSTTQKSGTSAWLSESASSSPSTPWKWRANCAWTRQPTHPMSRRRRFSPTANPPTLRTDFVRPKPCRYWLTPNCPPNCRTEHRCLILCSSRQEWDRALSPRQKRKHKRWCQARTSACAAR